MTTNLFKKVRDMLVTLLLLIIVVFLMFYIIPGNPARIMLGMNAPPEQVAALEASLGLNDPPGVRFVRYLSSVVRGNFGDSIRFDAPIVDLVAERLPVTLSLAGLAFLIVLLLAVTLGILASRKPGGALDNFIHVISEVHLAIPAFFMAMILRLIATAVWPALADASYVSVNEDSGAFFVSLILPAFAIALPKVALPVQLLRDSLVEQSTMDYVRTAQAKGAGRTRILFHHVLRNSVLPLVTALGLILTEIIGGSVIIEQVFSLPGIGRLLLTAVEARDFPLAQSIILIIGFVVVFLGFVVDLLSQWIDPRLREPATAKPRRRKTLGGSHENT